MPRPALLCFRLLFLNFFTFALLAPGSASAVDSAAGSRPPAPSPEEQQVLETYPSYSGPLHVLEANSGNGIHEFLAANDGQTVYLDLSIVRYVPLDPAALDRPDVIAATDRFENDVFTKCWPDTKEEPHGILNFGEAGAPLPLDAKDIEGGCSTRVRFDMEMIESVSAFPVSWGDNRAQIFVRGFFNVSKSAPEGGTTLYTLKEQADVPFEARLAFDKYKTTKPAEVNLSLQPN